MGRTVMRWFRKPMSASSNRFDPCILRILAEVNIGDRPQGKTFFVSPARFERATYCSASSCSIQLSYGLKTNRYILPYKRRFFFIQEELCLQATLQSDQPK